MEHEDFVTFDQAKRLNELGFDWECHEYYYNPTQRIIYTYGSNCFDFDNMTKAPTLAQAQKWLREVKGLHLWVESEPNEFHGEILYIFYILDEKQWLYPAIPDEKSYKTYE